MTDFMYGGEIGSVTPSSGGVYEYAFNFDPLRARCSIKLGTSADYALSPVIAGQTALWTHFRPVFGDAILNFPVYPFVILAGSAEIIRLSYVEGATEGSILQAQWNSSGVWTDIGSTFVLAIGALHTVDVYVNQTSGVVQVYSSGSLVASGTATLSGLAAMTQVKWSGLSATSMYISELAMSTTSTIGLEIYTLYPSGDGANTAWTGDYTAVDEIVYSDGDSITTAVANDVELFALSGPTLPTSSIRGVGVDARGKAGATGPTGLQLANRVSGTNYFSATQTPGAGFGAHCGVWVTSPATAAAWTRAEVLPGTLQAGVKAIA